MTPRPNGQAAVNPELTAQPQGPPWSNVDPWAIIGSLERQLGAQATEMAAMRAYIEQLHQELARLAGLPPEETPAPAAAGVG